MVDQQGSTVIKHDGDCSTAGAGLAGRSPWSTLLLSQNGYVRTVVIVKAATLQDLLAVSYSWSVAEADAGLKLKTSNFKLQTLNFIL